MKKYLTDFLFCSLLIVFACVALRLSLAGVVRVEVINDVKHPVPVKSWGETEIIGRISATVEGRVDTETSLNSGLFDKPFPVKVETSLSEPIVISERGY